MVQTQVALRQDVVGNVHQLPLNQQVPVMQRIPTVEVEVRAGDWASYQRATYEFRVRVPDSAFRSEKGLAGGLVLRHEWAVMFAQFKRERMREYLGVNTIRSFTREPKVLTPEFVQKLAVNNVQRREDCEPYFVKIAALYAQIEQLEWEIDNTMRRRGAK